jgi:serine/threonine protein kinase
VNGFALADAESTPASNTNSGRFAPGEVLQGTYRILRPLASGGMGELFLATHERLHGAFAVKVLHRDYIRDEEALCRFRCEAEVMAGLRHPNIVQVFDFNLTPDGSPYLVMELIEGKDLSEHLRGGRRLPPSRVARIVRQIASALEAAHAHGVVHRDLKPENVMLQSVEGQEDFVKVVDFGISKSRLSDRITAESAVLGTPQFMAPEQAQGLRDEVDARTDQFSLAAMTYNLLTGREPFQGDTGVAILYQVVHQDAEPLSKHVDWPCAYVDAVLRRAMAKDRQARFPTILEFARALEEAIAVDLGKTPVPTCSAGAVRLVAPRSDTEKTPRLPTSRKTLRCRQRAPRVRCLLAGRMLGLIAAGALALVLATGRESMGSAVADAYRSAVTATSRTFSKFYDTADAPIAPPDLHDAHAAVAGGPLP